MVSRRAGQPGSVAPSMLCIENTGFKIPSLLPQDLALIMEFIDPPQSDSRPLSPAKDGSRPPRQSSVQSDDIESSGTESENEVEAEISISRSPAAGDPDSSDDADSDSESSSDSETSSSASSEHVPSKRPAPIDLDLDEDGPQAAAYVPSAHELPPSAVLPLPDPSALPPDPLEYTGEIATVLQDTVVVRGGGPSGTGYLTPRARRDAALDEGSLLFFEDRSMLGHVYETFGPTEQPHYVVRFHTAVPAAAKKMDIPSAPQKEYLDGTDAHLKSEGFDVSKSKPFTTSKSVSPSNGGPDPSKLKVSTPIYHIPSLSHYVFPGALARQKGSDASNFHDEEPAEHELEFSDDEAEAAHRRRRNRSMSRASSSVPEFKAEYMSNNGDDASSLYGESPYDFEEGSSHMQLSHPQDVPGTPVAAPDFPASLTDPAVQEALMLARKSRGRRQSTASISDSGHTDGPSVPVNDGASYRGRGRGRGRGRTTNRPRSGPHTRNNNNAFRRGRPHDQDFQSTQAPGHESVRLFSFEEYDPRMPRPPSPMALTIARATGQWTDGMPFPYQYSYPTPQQQQQQQPLPFGRQNPSQELYSPSIFEQQQQHWGSTPPYHVTPHINPRFAHALAFAAGEAPQVSPQESSSSQQEAYSEFPPPPGESDDRET